MTGCWHANGGLLCLGLVAGGLEKGKEGGCGNGGKVNGERKEVAGRYKGG